MNALMNPALKGHLVAKVISDMGGTGKLFGWAFCSQNSFNVSVEFGSPDLLSECVHIAGLSRVLF